LRDSPSGAFRIADIRTELHATITARFIMQGFWQKLRSPHPRSLIEVLTAIAITAAGVAYFVGPTKWASSGEIKVPVRVFVFDARQARPISNARVGLFHKVVNARELKPDVRDLAVSFGELPNVDLGTTGADGIVTIPHGFRTGANYERPAPYAHLWMEWVLVDAPGYGRVATPVRYQSIPTKSLREQGELAVTIGLTPVE
jgi:hypothetical protein